MTKNASGFTIVEISIVIVIISILTSVVIIGYSQILINSRDSARASKISAIGEALETYYVRSGEYPGCAAMSQNGINVSKNVLQGIDPNTLVAPRSSSGATNSIICSALTGGNGPDNFGYVGDGSSTCGTGSSCLQYTLQYRQESTGNIISLQSTHKASVRTSGTPVLSAQAASSSQINLTWTPVDNATGYKLQQATNSTFTAGLIETSINATATAAIGLAAQTTYYFRVIPLAINSEGNWSNTASATTN